MGHDIDIGGLYLEYVNALKNLTATCLYEGMTQAGSEEQRKRHALRKVFHSGLSVPHRSIEALWKAYEAFEQEVLRAATASGATGAAATAKNAITEWQTRVSSLKGVYRERKKHYDGLQLDAIPFPAGARSLSAAASSAAATQEALWASVVAYELNNAQRMDDATLARRLRWVHECRVCYLHRHPFPWLDYARWHVSETNVAEARAVYARAREALGGSFLPIFFEHFLDSS